jgi:hypothetical protein
MNHALVNGSAGPAGYGNIIHGFIVRATVLMPAFALSLIVDACLTISSQACQSRRGDEAIKRRNDHE